MFFWREQIEGGDRPGPAGAPPPGGHPGPAHGSGVDWGFTSTGRGAGRGEYGAFNLGGHVGDDPGAVESNRSELARAVGVPRSRLLFMNQVHGTDVVRVDGPWDGAAPAADGLVTTDPDLALAVLVADCVPVLLADVGRGVVGVLHAGRPGMIGGIVERGLQAMAQAGARDVRAAVGPSICARCYEVPASMRDEAAAVSPASAAVSWTGTPAIDVGAGVVDQLAREGVPLTWVPGCTRETPHLYSYRRAARTGRFAGVVRAWSAA